MKPFGSAIGRRGTFAGIATTVGTLAVLLLSGMAAQATPLAAGASSPQHWASGSQYWYNNSSAVAYGRFYSANRSVELFYGVEEQITATNTSANTTQLEGQQWVNASLVYVVCQPNCTSPQSEWSYNYSGTSLETQFLNLTTQASVYENGSATSALGVTNASAQGSQTLTLGEAYAASYNRSGYWGSNNGSYNFSYSFEENETSYYTIAFATPLGLVPWNVSSAGSWNDSASFTATGGWNDTYSVGTSGMGRGWVGMVNRSGDESVYGRNLGPRNTTANATSLRIAVRYRGPFNFDDDLFMTAVGSDLFQGATANWSVQSRPGFGAIGQPVDQVYAEHAAAPSTGSGGSSGTTTSGSIGVTGPTSIGGSTTSTGAGTTSNSGSNSGTPTSTGGTSTSSTGTGGTGTSTPGSSSGHSVSNPPTARTPGSGTAVGSVRLSGFALTLVAMLAIGSVAAIAAVGYARRRPRP